MSVEVLYQVSPTTLLPGGAVPVVLTVTLPRLTVILPPMFKLPVIPAPPCTCSAPDVVLVLAAPPLATIFATYSRVTNSVPTKLVLPNTTRLPPTYKLLPMAAPPVTTNAPEVVLLLCAVLLMVILLVVVLP